MRNMLNTIVVFCMLACCWSAQAQEQRAPTAPTWECLKKASETFSIPVPVILAIARTEGGKVGMESVNSNGSYDLGPMQINDRVLVPVLARITGVDQTYMRVVLRDHGCANLTFGTWILRQQYDQSGDLATAVGWYHSRTPVHMSNYQEKFRKNLMFLIPRMANGK